MPDMPRTLGRSAVISTQNGFSEYVSRDRYVVTKNRSCCMMLRLERFWERALVICTKPLARQGIRFDARVMKRHRLFSSKYVSSGIIRSREMRPSVCRCSSAMVYLAMAWKQGGLISTPAQHRRFIAIKLDMVVSCPRLLLCSKRLKIEEIVIKSPCGGRL